MNTRLSTAEHFSFANVVHAAVTICARIVAAIMIVGGISGVYANTRFLARGILPTLQQALLSVAGIIGAAIFIYLGIKIIKQRKNDS